MHANAATPSCHKPPFPGADVQQPLAIRSARVLSLLLVLETLRQAEAGPAGRKL